MEDLEKRVRNLPVDVLVGGLMHKIGIDINSKKIPLMLRKDLRTKIFEAALSDTSKEMADIDFNASIIYNLDVLSEITGLLIVSISSANSSILRKKTKMSKEKYDLITRAIEDHFIEMLTTIVKERVLSNHLSYNDFLKKKD